MKVREKRAKLKESEAELARRHEATRRALEAQARELDERQRALHADKLAWERDTGLSLDDLRRRSLEANSKEYVKHTPSLRVAHMAITDLFGNLTTILCWVNPFYVVPGVNM